MPDDSPHYFSNHALALTERPNHPMDKPPESSVF